MLFSALVGSTQGGPLVAKAWTSSSRALLRLSELFYSHEHTLNHIKRVQGRVQSLQTHTQVKPGQLRTKAQIPVRYVDTWRLTDLNLGL